MVWSSFASELVLATVAACSAIFLMRGKPGTAWAPAAAGLGFLAIAATLGSVRYGFGLHLVSPMHDVTSRVASAVPAVVGLAWWASGFRHRAWGWGGAAVLALAVVLAVVWTTGPWAFVLGVTGVIIGLVAAFTWLRASPSAAVLGIVGAGTIAVAGLAFSDRTASLWGLPHLDWFHITLAAGVAMYAGGVVSVRRHTGA